MKKKSGNQAAIRFPRETCGDFFYATQKEWLETNGIGGFASSTIIGANVRRYHGLLIASLKPPTHRFVFLSKIEESISVNGKSYDLSVNQYPFIIYPEGHKNLEQFEYDLFPRFEYRPNGIFIEKSIVMVYGENTTLVRYRVGKAAQPFTMNLRPLCAFRDYHSLSKENAGLDHNIQMSDRFFSMQPYQGLPRMFIYHSSGKSDSKFFWYKNAEYRKEQDRGLEFSEDLFGPALLTVSLKEGDVLDVVATVDEQRSQNLASLNASALWDQEIKRRKKIIRDMPLETELAQSLALAADSFLVRRNDGEPTIMAGYHWFTDWGRDSMIALTGLCLTTKKFDIAKRILASFAQFISQGMIPNRFPDMGEQPEYNNVDGTLWYFIAAYNYVKYSGDFDFIKKELYEKLKDIIDWHIRGTRYHIKMDEDGLLFAGEEGVQLTWMDAKIGDWVVTPRMGKPVEINALWYNVLCIMAEFAKKMNRTDDVKQFAARAAKAKESFNAQFWNGEYLYDYINGSERNSAIRPNQIFAVSLPFDILPLEKQKAVVGRVLKELLTPAGLRSLPSSHPDYVGKYGGSPHERDAAYHQGTVWSWLIGPFIEAYLKVNKNSITAKKYCRSFLDQWIPRLSDEGLGTVSEIFDADPPHLPKGCIAQAWSVAEILRAIELVAKNVPKKDAAKKNK